MCQRTVNVDEKEQAGFAGVPFITRQLNSTTFMIRERDRFVSSLRRLLRLSVLTNRVNILTYM